MPGDHHELWMRLTENGLLFMHATKAVRYLPEFNPNSVSDARTNVLNARRARGGLPLVRMGFALQLELPAFTHSGFAANTSMQCCEPQIKVSRFRLQHSRRQRPMTSHLF